MGTEGHLAGRTPVGDLDSLVKRKMTDEDMEMDPYESIRQAWKAVEIDAGVEVAGRGAPTMIFLLLENFREERIDGTSLPLLTEEHLTNSLSMKLGPALKLKANIARRLGHCAICLHCVHCHGASSLNPGAVAGTAAAAAATTATTTTPATNATPTSNPGHRPNSTGN